MTYMKKIITHNVLLALCFPIFLSCNDDDFAETVESFELTYSELECRYPNLSIYEGFSSSFEECGSEINPTDFPIGGGANYTDVITILQAQYYIHTVEELLTALNDCQDGDILLLNPQNQFDLTGYPTLTIDKSITLASNRARSTGSGALLFDSDITLGTSQNSKSIFINITADQVRITGLQIQGPHPEIYRNDIKRSKGIQIQDADCVEIDNCEISQWTHSGIYISESLKSYVHHNFFHNCQGYGLGYAVSLYGESESIIEANNFRINRHDIAGSGDLGQRYTARYNNIIRNANLDSAHSFDMHCIQESTNNCNGPYNVAGSIIKIYNNNFNDNRNTDIKIRGNPHLGAWIELNKSKHDSLNQFLGEFPREFKIFYRDNCLSN